MSLIVKDKSGTDYEPLAAGMHHAICYGLIDLGTQPTNNPQFRPARKVAFLWEVPSERIEFEKDGVKKNLPRSISGIWTLTLASKGKLRPMLESWRGRPFTAEELDGFDLKNIPGANCLLNVVHNHKGDKTYANVASVNPLAKGMAKQGSENPHIFFSIDDCKGAKITAPEAVPDWLKAKIMQSEECMREQRAAGAPDATDEQLANRTEQIDEDVPF